MQSSKHTALCMLVSLSPLFSPYQDIKPTTLFSFRPKPSMHLSFLLSDHQSLITHPGHLNFPLNLHRLTIIFPLHLRIRIIRFPARLPLQQRLRLLSNTLSFARWFSPV